MAYNKKNYQSLGLLVLMGTHLFCKQELGVRFSYGPPSFRSYRIVALPWLCNPVTAVQFCLGAPIFMQSDINRIGDHPISTWES
jgi:hypothetical protein